MGEIKVIPASPKWTNAGLYSDQGITGLSTKKRKGFQKMMKDAKVVLDRGSILTNADIEPVGGDAFGPQSYHNGDYALYYNNRYMNLQLSSYLGLIRLCNA